ncbi:hypothetical protein EV361DRAFT_942357 [Lentinula raphanica]|nr:hypothetical protein EV361DRAFT_942357 [Lentinula raphanica]
MWNLTRPSLPLLTFSRMASLRFGVPAGGCLGLDMIGTCIVVGMGIIASLRLFVFSFLFVLIPCVFVTGLQDCTCGMPGSPCLVSWVDGVGLVRWERKKRNQLS